ncbi:phiSA1p31-related protein [Streptomyces sp. NPDC060064]|uniref:phiSA1p31-related protein n=1 Tax=Streptomyces sp. NPDC060064 TaxID=3347049 RepID=UPI0036A006A7
MRTHYLHDDVDFDLTRTFVDVVGVEWRWSGQWSAAGEPLMRAAGDTTGVPLPDVYHDHGPLIPVPTSLSAGLVTAVLAGEAVAP